MVEKRQRERQVCFNIIFFSFFRPIYFFGKEKDRFVSTSSTTNRTCKRTCPNQRHGKIEHCWVESRVSSFHNSSCNTFLKTKMQNTSRLVIQLGVLLQYHYISCGKQKNATKKAIFTCLSVPTSPDVLVQSLQNIIKYHLIDNQDADQNSHKEQLNFYKRTNQQLKSQLEGINSHK